MTRGTVAALLAGASLLTLAVTTEATARGGRHFGGHIGGGHFGGGHFGGRPAFRPQHRIDRHRFEGRERHFNREDHRGGAERRVREDRPDHRRPDRNLARDRDLRHPNDHRDARLRRDLRRADLDRAGLHRHWNHNAFFGPRFAAHDFHCYRGCRWGWAGAVFWPFALGDIFSYAWWPYAGVPAFWNYGVDTILTGLFWPHGAYEWPDGQYGAYAWTGDGQYQVARESHQDVYSTGPQNEPGSSTQNAGSGPDATQTCGGFAPGVGILPVDKIQAAVKPTGSQESLFAALKTASSKAEAILAASCPSDPPLTPVGRLDALEQRLDGMKRAIATVEGPLAAFSGTLSKEQQQALNALGDTDDGSSADSQAVGLGNCRDEGDEFNGLPSKTIAAAVKPNDAQRSELTKLEMVTEQKAEWLRAQCPGSVPATAQARLEAMAKRVDETIEAVKAVRPSLVAFYDSLSDEQKAHFNTLPSEAAIDQP